MNIDQATKEKIFEKIEAILKESPISNDPIHAASTLKWVKVLRSDADDALEIAAYAHDMERGITKITNKDLKDMSSYNKDREEHSLRSVNFTADILKEFNCDPAFIKEVSHLIELHEVGGDPLSDALKDADSLAYFEHNVPLYLERNGLEKAKFKIKYMFDRVSSQKAKQLILEMKYNGPAIKELIQEVLEEK